MAAAELAVFDTLTAGVTLGVVYQDVPAGTQAPIVIVAEMTADPLSSKVSKTVQIALTISSEVWAAARRPILLLKQEVKDALHGKTLFQDGFEIKVLWLNGDARQVDERTYFGTDEFTVFVSPV